MDESFDLTDIQNATGITVQRLRYVIDQRLLPGGSGPSWRRGRGSPRVFTRFEAFGVACAALLLKAGLQRRVIKDCLQMICSHVVGRRDAASVPLYQACQERSTAYLEIGDGNYVRLVGAEDYLRKTPLLGWVDTATKTPVEMYEPLVAIRIDVARLRRLLKN